MVTLKKIKLTKLFGTFNHEIPIKEDRKITLILGENGLGKTVILKMLKIIFNGNFLDLKNYDFERIDLEFEDFKFSFFGSTNPENERLIVRKYKGNKKQEELDFLNYDDEKDHYLSRSRYDDRAYFDNDFMYHHQSRHNFDPEMEYVMDRYLSKYVRQIGSSEWLDRRTGKVLRTDRVLRKYAKLLPKRFQAYGGGIPDWLEELSNRINIYLIETQRLRSKKGSDSYEDAVLELSKDLSQRIKGVLATANEFAAQLDRSYPNRLVARINKLETISDEELNSQLEFLEKRRTKLRNVGLVDPFDDIQQKKRGAKKTRSNEKRDELINNVLLVYVEDSNNKLNIYDDIADKLEVFIGILNERLNVKNVKIDKEDGLKVISDKDKRKIPITGLSSGEQHMIILFYNLLFKCQKNSLILIDEPEISLHINWQNNFINDLSRINKITPFDSLIATHSPDIIDDNWDLTVELKED